MPVVTRRDNDPIPRGATRSDSKAWITVVVMFGSILLAVVLVAAVIRFCRRRSYHEAKKRDPSLTHKEFLRRSKMSALAREREAEVQRRIMIRKSLASRSTDLSGQFDNESWDTDERRESNLKEDWKGWEARMERERPERSCRHPSTVVLPGPPLPTKARSISPSSSPLLSGQSPAWYREPPQRGSLGARAEESVNRYGIRSMDQAI